LPRRNPVNGQDILPRLATGIRVPFGPRLALGSPSGCGGLTGFFIGLINPMKLVLPSLQPILVTLYTALITEELELGLLIIQPSPAYAELNAKRLGSTSNGIIPIPTSF
jgi:ribose/xylose/arabinose/galactoside ABC-type transport system permease subunit